MEQKKATRAKHQRNRLAIVITILLAVAVLFGAGTGTYMWSQTRYYVGNSNGKVAIYQGVPTNLFGLALSHEVSSTSITVSNLRRLGAISSIGVFRWAPWTRPNRMWALFVAK